jgi:hypothetical protein
MLPTYIHLAPELTSGAIPLPPLCLRGYNYRKLTSGAEKNLWVGVCTEWNCYGLSLQSSEPRVRLRLKCDGARAETIFRLSAKRTSPFKSAGASFQSPTSTRVVRISGSNAGYTVFRGSVKSTGYPLHSPVSLSLPHPCVTVCRHISAGFYLKNAVHYVYCADIWNLSPLYRAVWCSGGCSDASLGRSHHCVSL